MEWKLTRTRRKILISTQATMLAVDDPYASIATHATELLETAPLLLHDLHASLNRTLHLNAEGERCWAHTGEPTCGLHFRTIPEMFYSAALRDDQIGEMYRLGAGAVDCAGARGCPNSAKFLSVGCPAGGSLIFTPIPFGLAYGLLLADMPDEFLLHYFASTAHSYTRGSWTTPESAQLDRDEWSIAYNTAGQTIAPIYLKWALAFEDPRSQTLWLAKGVPRGMLEPGVAPIDAQRVPTRYGRVGLRLHTHTFTAHPHARGHRARSTQLLWTVGLHAWHPHPLRRWRLAFRHPHR